MKKGRTTNVTRGIYGGEFSLAKLHFGFEEKGPFYLFEKCYRIFDEDSTFFDEGDSGSGVFLIDRKGSGIQPLGIAFGRYCGFTLVCKIKHIAERFHLSVLKDDVSNWFLNDYLNGSTR